MEGPETRRKVQRSREQPRSSHQGKRRRDTKGESDNKHRERPFRHRPTGEKSCYERRSEAQFACRPLTKDDRDGQKDRGLDDGNCKQFPDFDAHSNP